MKGGLLAMPKDKTTDDFLLQLKNKADRWHYFWFGLSDENSEGQWVWEDGEILYQDTPWSDWREGEPNNRYGDEDCAHYSPQAWPGWNDILCSRKVAKFICQTKEY
ncbi:hepatic lectin-like [Branchiostoma floridae x Branchiostoma japonicum]